jgi:hypothetical protein
MFDSACRPVPVPQVITILGGSPDHGLSSYSTATFTVRTTGPVIATVLASTTGPFQLRIEEVTGAWSAPGPWFYSSTFTFAHWDNVPPGTYRLTVLADSAVAGMSSVPSISWNASVQYP